MKPRHLSFLLFCSGYIVLASQVLLFRLYSLVFGTNPTVQISIITIYFCFVGITTLLVPKTKSFIILGLICTLLATSLSLGLWMNLDYFINFLSLYFKKSFLFILFFSIPFALSCSLFLPGLDALKGLNAKQGFTFTHSYMLFNLGAIFGLVATETLFQSQLGYLGAHVPLISMLVISFFILLFQHWAQTPETTAKPVINRLLLQFCLTSLACGLIQFQILHLYPHFVGPFSFNFVAISACSLIGITLGSYLLIRLKITISQWHQFIPNLLTGCILFSTVCLYGLPYLNFIVPNILVSHFLFLLLAFSPIYLILSLYVPLSIRDTNLNSSMALGFNFLFNSLGLFIGSSLMSSPHYLLIIFICLALTLILISGDHKKFLNARLQVLWMPFIVIWFIFFDQNILSYSYRYFQNPEVFKQTRENLKSIQTYRSQGSQFSLHFFKNQTQSLIIDGYKSISIDQASGHAYLETQLSVLPALFSNKSRAAVVGVGSGITVSAIAPYFDHIDAIEVHPAIFEHNSIFDPFNQGLSKKPNVSLVHDDGFRYLMLKDQQYDLIINNVPTPQHSPASSIWTQEFLRIVKKRLRPDGLFSSWISANTSMTGIEVMMKTLQSEFENCALGVLNSRYFTIFCSLDLNAHFDSHNGLVFPLHNFKSLDFAGEVNRLGQPSLAKIIGFDPDSNWNEHENWFAFKLFDISEQEIQASCQTFSSLTKQFNHFGPLPNECENL